MMKLVVVEDGVRTEIDLPGGLVRVGRAIDNDIRLSGHQVSRHHCRIEAGPDGVWAIDLGSSNGTLVNDEPIERRLLAPGDRVRIGRAEIEVELPREESGVAPPGAAPAPALSEVGFQTLAGDSRRERDNLRVFARITRELLRETDLARLLRLIVDSAIALVGGERGFLLLSEEAARGEVSPPSPDGGAGLSGMKVRIARSFDREDIPVPSTRLSVGIARMVIETREALLTVDASSDPRFDGMASVEDLRLRSVMCVPLDLPAAGPSAGGASAAPARAAPVAGVLYIDHRLQPSVFSADDLQLLRLLADQAAIALRNARRLTELRQRNEKLAHSGQKIELLNQQLGRKVRDRDTELAVVRAELGRERGRYDYTAIVGASEGMRRVFQQLDRIIESDLPVLIRGESGTGKELIARAIHFNGPRKHKPFVSENCAALPDTLLESELFGHTRGAFTGAHRSKKGLLEQADGGTLLLDEIGDMSAEMQKKLLRVLQEGEFRAVGSEEQVKVDVRMIAASHRDLSAMVRAGSFREDLYYRVHVLAIDLPPLRERREDVPLLAEALLARAAREAGRPVPLVPREVLAALVDYEWPGNVRELENEMRRLIVLAGGEIRLEHLSPAVQERRSILPRAEAGAAGPRTIRDAVADLERRSVLAAIEAAGGHKSRAAASLGISRFALQRKLDKYKMEGKNGGRAGDAGGEAGGGAAP